LRALGRVVRHAPEVRWPYLGYGVEFLYVPDEGVNALIELVQRETAPPPPTLIAEPRPEVMAIRTTLRREGWVYEILDPVPNGALWQVEIRRSARDGWRPGIGGPFYVLEAPSPEEALESARAFVRRNG
jgi:hypothetical protein